MTFALVRVADSQGPRRRATAEDGRRVQRLTAGHAAEPPAGARPKIAGTLGHDRDVRVEDQTRRQQTGVGCHCLEIAAERPDRPSHMLPTHPASRSSSTDREKPSGSAPPSVMNVDGPRRAPANAQPGQHRGQRRVDGPQRPRAFRPDHRHRAAARGAANLARRPRAGSPAAAV